MILIRSLGEIEFLAVDVLPAGPHLTVCVEPVPAASDLLPAGLHQAVRLEPVPAAVDLLPALLRVSLSVQILPCSVLHCDPASASRSRSSASLFVDRRLGKGLKREREHQDEAHNEYSFLVHTDFPLILPRSRGIAKADYISNASFLKVHTRKKDPRPSAGRGS